MLFLITIGLILSSDMIVLASILLEQEKFIIGGIVLAVGIVFVCVLRIFYAGLKVVGPNEVIVLTLFGNYYRTLVKQAFYYVNSFVSFNNPIYYRQRE